MSSHVPMSSGAASSAARRSSGTSGSGHSFVGVTSTATSVPPSSPSAFSSAASTEIQCPFFPSGSRTVSKAWSFIFALTATCPREGSSLLAASGSRTMSRSPSLLTSAEKSIDVAGAEFFFVAVFSAIAILQFRVGGRIGFPVYSDCPTRRSCRGANGVAAAGFARSWPQPRPARARR